MYLSPLSIAEKFRAYLAPKLEPVTMRERIVMMNACWEWARKKKLVVENPWAEISLMVRKFRSDSNLIHYADYVEFKFGVGLRTPEAAALLWRHCSTECFRIWIGESLTNGNRKSTKTNKARTVPLTDRLQQILLGEETTFSLMLRFLPVPKAVRWRTAPQATMPKISASDMGNPH